MEWCFEICPQTVSCIRWSCMQQTSIDILYCAGRDKKKKLMKVIKVSWSKPNIGWFKINTDGSSLTNPGPAKGDCD